jgi:ParB family chromosome partitioning protein
MTDTATTQTDEPITLEWFDPADIATDANMRLRPNYDRLVESIKVVGANLEPVTLLRAMPGRHWRPCEYHAATGPADEPAAPADMTECPDCRELPYVALYGNQRVLACAAAKTRVRGYVAGNEGDSKDDVRGRLIGQYHENHMRADPTAAEDALVVAALFETGLTEAGISRKLRMAKPHVRAARAAAASELAVSVAMAYPLDLMQTAQVAEFAANGDEDAVVALCAVADQDPAQFDHTAARLLESAPERAQRRALIAALEAAGVKVVDAQWSNEVDGLRDEAGEKLTAEGHAGCPGHAAFVHSTQRHDAATSRWVSEWAAVYVCTDPEANGHRKHPALTGAHTRTDDAQAERQRLVELAEGRRVREGNKEWRAARTVRTGHLVTLAARPASKLTKADLDLFGDFIDDYLAGGGYELRQAMERGHPFGCEILGLIPAKGENEHTGAADRREALAALRAKASKQRRRQISVVLLCAAIEKQMDQDTWRDCTSSNAFWRQRSQADQYLAFLEATGHAMAPVERWVAQANQAEAGARYTPLACAADPEPPLSAVADGTGGDGPEAASDDLGDADPANYADPDVAS